MLKYNCLIVEDEPLAAEILTDYIRQVPFLELKKVCPDAIYAMEALQSEKIDLVFLDVHLPKLKGFDFLQSLQKPPYIIITSAYGEYALQAFDENVLDYLLKPIRFTRFLKAVNKLQQKNDPAPVTAINNALPERPFLFFNVDKRKVKLFLDEILYVESVRDYVHVTTREQNVPTRLPISQLEDILANDNFLRVHRSFIVARDKITAFTATDIEIGSLHIPIGRSYKELVMTALEKNNF